MSGLEGIRAQRHRLDAAGSPLLRALPDYARQFQAHLLLAHARHEASQQRCAPDAAAAALPLLPPLVGAAVTARGCCPSCSQPTLAACRQLAPLPRALPPPASHCVRAW